MKSFTLLASAALTALASLPLATGASIPSYLEMHHTSRRELSHAQVQAELGPLLSRNATIIGPGGPGTIVKLANALGIPFMVKSRGHAPTDTVGRFRGIQIDMSKLQRITIQPGGGSNTTETAWFQGGTYDNDNLVNLNVVLANGSATRVNATSHPDLWWGMQGAGHNFGIVTSFQSKIYPKKVDTWHYHSYIFTQDKLESLFEALNVLHGHGDGSTPALMTANFGMFQTVPSISQAEPAITWVFGYAGPAAEAEALLEPYNRLGPAAQESGDMPYPQVAPAMGSGMDQPICEPGHAHVQSTPPFDAYNVTAERELYGLLARTFARHPQLAAGAFAPARGVLDRGRGRGGPGRLLMLFETRLPLSDATPENLRLARELVREAREVWNAGAPGLKPASYVNYANGDEPLEPMYGYEPWRLQRLRALKRQYDPHGRFSYYNPIPSQ
ncbi:hypothetical protein GGTG_01165 [Gaeumannomyces tritici R3-111a-1]|uniref:Berberine/berberine-like domain-containing protein n=1 Tax=Gaeumannomyces tritici (strain R3-111a-1) TaxID=644352 RepID=J3NIT1_GAET3|nr:hypothetical protein GGTG_01165 [Gaeumannomyces tritici R3-111a-1]EJT81181.1 hypothetical protein GGTG_01165 [Gaeumannomyces tritici R3-111a-1]